MREPSPLAICQYPKLVRDRMPQIISSEGRTPNFTKLDLKAKQIALKDKLLEEYTELVDAIKNNNRQSIAEEIADLIEVLTALTYSFDIYPNEVDDIREKKNIIKGKFNDGIWMESIT